MDAWLNRYYELEYFLMQNDKKYPTRSNSNEKLFRWYRLQKQKTYKKTKYQKNLLKQLPNWKWSRKFRPWIDSFNKLKEFITINKIYPSRNPQNSKSEIRLYHWYKKQISIYNEKRIQYDLKINQIKLLTQLPNWKWS